jgi:hypothetical protein
MHGRQGGVVWVREEPDLRPRGPARCKWSSDEGHVPLAMRPRLFQPTLSRGQAPTERLSKRA